MFSGAEHKRGYQCYVLDTVARDSALKPLVRAIPGTMKLHQVEFDSATLLRVKQLSSDPDCDNINLRFGKPWHLLPAAPSASAVAPTPMQIDSEPRSAAEAGRKRPADAAELKEPQPSKQARAGEASDVHDTQHTPGYVLDDQADKELFSTLTFEQARALKHVDVVCAVPGSEVRLWRVSELTPDEDTQTFRVRLREWPRIVISVKAERLQKHSASVPCV